MRTIGRLTECIVGVKYASYDKTELIATSQALVVYMLVRLAEGETEHNNSDALLLNTINVSCCVFHASQVVAEHM